MSCGYCLRSGHNSRTCPEVPSRVFRPATERLGEAEARIAKLEHALGNTVAALKHYGPFPYIADTRVVSEAEKLLGEAK